MAETHQADSRDGASYSIADAARLLGVSESAIRKRVERGLLPVVSGSGPIRVNGDAVDDERRRNLARLDAEGDAERQLLRDEVARLSDALERATTDRNRLQAAMESLLQSDAALRDTVAQLIAEARVVD